MEWEDLPSVTKSKAPARRTLRGCKGVVLTDDKVIGVMGGRKFSKSEQGKFDLAEVTRIERETRPKNRKNGRPIFFRLFGL